MSTYKSKDEKRAETDSQGRRGFLKKAVVTGILGITGTTVGTGTASATETPKSAAKSEPSSSFASRNAATADYIMGTRVSPTDYLNIRAQAGLGGEVVATIPPHATGQILNLNMHTVVMDGYTWNIVGWHGSNYVGWCATEYLADIGDVPDPGLGGAVTIEVNLNMRSQPGLGGEVVATIPSGRIAASMTDITFEIDGYTWGPVWWDNGNYAGWCATEYFGPVIA